jgi:hypothetical protein
MCTIVYCPDTDGQKANAHTRMPEDIPLKRVAEKPQQIVLNTENFNKEIHKTLIVVFSGTVNQDYN